MQTLAHCINNGWPEKYKSVSPEVRSFFPVRDKLITSNNIVIKSERVVVLEALCATYIVQDTLGLMPQRMARDTVYWPTIAKDTDTAVASCKQCNRTKLHQQKEQMLIHPVPNPPWFEVSASFFDWNGIEEGERSGYDYGYELAIDCTFPWPF